MVQQAVAEEVGSRAGRSVRSGRTAGLLIAVVAVVGSVVAGSGSTGSAARTPATEAAPAAGAHAEVQSPATGVVGVALDATGGGSWTATRDGRVTASGDAAGLGSVEGPVASPIVGIAGTPSGAGFWLVAADGGIFSFGDAVFQGSTGSLSLNQPIVGMAATPSGAGYWLVAADGGIFSYGDAGFRGSLAGSGATVTGIAARPGVEGYALATTDGRVERFSSTDAESGEVLAAGVPAGTAHAFMQTDDAGRPARFDPCQPVHYVVNLAGAPPSAASDVAGALARLAAATGLEFVDDGPTREPASADRPPYQPERYGDRWAPLLIAWAPPGGANPGLVGSVVALGGSLAVGTPDGGWAYVTGQVALNQDFAGVYPGGFGSGLTLGETLLHELGHVVGLAHVDDPGEIMFPIMSSREAELGPGDLAGLHELGTAGGCHPAPEPWWLRDAPQNTTSAPAAPMLWIEG
jgi:hypothetical protein